MEYLENCLTDIVAIEDSDMAVPPLSEQQIAYIIRNVLLALKHLHSLGWIHRDVRADNILLSSEGLVKLGKYLSPLIQYLCLDYSSWNLFIQPILDKAHS